MTWEPSLDYRFYLVLVIALAGLLGLSVRFARRSACPEWFAGLASGPDPGRSGSDPAQSRSGRQGGASGTSTDRDLPAGRLPEHGPRVADLASGAAERLIQRASAFHESRSWSPDPILPVWKPSGGHGEHGDCARTRGE